MFLDRRMSAANTVTSVAAGVAGCAAGTAAAGCADARAVAFTSSSLPSLALLLTIGSLPLPTSRVTPGDVTRTGSSADT